MVSKSALLLAAAQAASAHFALVYPEWRIDTLAQESSTVYSQWNYPCAGAKYGEGNVTDWPLDGPSLELTLHHPWTYIFVNLGLGNGTTNYNISLTPEFWNATGKGTLCVDKLPVPAGIEDGTLATLQVVTSGTSGSALYNCADVRFKKDAKKLTNCSTTAGLKVQNIKDQATLTSTQSNSTAPKANGTTKSDGKGSGNAAGMVSVNVALTSFAGLAAAYALSL